MTNIRAYSLADKVACLRIFESNIPKYFDATERDLLSSFLDNPDGQYFIAERDGEVVGCGGIAREDQGQARFTWGMVHRDHHGDGLGRLLAEYRLQKIERSDEYSHAELFTTPQVAPFFAKFGFEVRNIETDGFAPGMDRVQMIKPVGSMPACDGNA